MRQQKFASFSWNKPYILQTILLKLILYFFLSGGWYICIFFTLNDNKSIKKGSVRSSGHNDLNCIKVGRARLDTQSCLGYESNTICEFPEVRSFEKYTESDSFLAMEQNVRIGSIIGG